MKKIIYGIVILICLFVVSTNFIEDGDSIDFNQASASGTACRWISDKGYGSGPIYFDNDSIVTDSVFAASILRSGLKLMSCDTFNVGYQYDSGKIYSSNNSDSLLTSRIEINATWAVNCPSSSYYIQVTNGVVTKYQVPDSYNLNSSGKWACSGVKNVENLEDYKYEFLPKYTNVKNESDALELVSPTKYTCVCAEY